MKLSTLAVTAILPAAVFFAPGVSANPTSPDDLVAPGAVSAPCCAESLPADLPAAPADLPAAPADLPAAPADLPAAPADLPAAPADLPEAAPVTDAAGAVPEALTDATAVAHVDSGSLPAGVASEHGLQIRTILVERNISAAFPQIHTMIGVRPDAKPWHPNGLALDIMIPNPGSSEGIALGNAIRDYALANAARLGIQDVIWQGTYYTPAGPGGSGYGHFDHVHITTTGGGYPSGGEAYPRVGI